MSSNQSTQHPDSIVGAFEKIGWLDGFAVFLVQTLSLGPQVVLRRNFGERHFSQFGPPMYFLTMWFFLAVTYAISEQPATAELVGSYVPISLFSASVTAGAFPLLLTVQVFYLFHRAVIFYRNRKGQEWHSRYDGDSLPVFTSLDRFAEKWHFLPRFSKLIGEPSICFILGLLLIPGYRFVGGWVAISGLLLFVYEGIVWENIRHRYLDKVDARLEAQYELALRNPEVPRKELDKKSKEKRLPIYMPINDVRERIFEAQGRA